jgi:hypothetical protein
MCWGSSVSENDSAGGAKRKVGVDRILRLARDDLFNVRTAPAGIARVLQCATLCCAAAVERGDKTFDEGSRILLRRGGRGNQESEYKSHMVRSAGDSVICFCFVAWVTTGFFVQSTFGAAFTRQCFVLLAVFTVMLGWIPGTFIFGFGSGFDRLLSLWHHLLLFCLRHHN